MSKRQSLRYAAVTATLILPLAMLAGRTINMSVANAQSQNTCTLETIAGTYLFHGEGVMVTEGEPLPYAEAGTWTFDGEGNAEGVMSGSKNGESYVTREAFTASYELTADCVYKIVDQFGVEVDLYTTTKGTPMTYYSAGLSGVQLRQ